MEFKHDRFILVYSGQRVRNLLDSQEWLEVYGGAGPYLYDTIDKVIFPFFQNPQYKVENIQKENHVGT